MEAWQQGDIVEVEWDDAHFEIDSPDVWPAAYPCRTVGYVLTEETEWVRLAQEWTADDEPRAITSIPTSSIRRAWTLRPKSRHTFSRAERSRRTC